MRISKDNIVAVPRRLARRFWAPMILLLLALMARATVIQLWLEKIYQTRQADYLQILRWVDFGYSWLMLGLLTILVLFFVIPSYKILKNAIFTIKAYQKNLTALFRISHGAQMVVYYDTYQVVAMNLEAEKLIRKTKAGEILHFPFDGEKQRFNFVQWINSSFSESTSLTTLLEQGQEISNQEHRLYEADGAESSILFSSVMGYYEGKSTLLVNITDITPRKHSEEELQNMIIRDELTGAYNRHFIDRQMEREIQKADQYRIPMAMFLFDLDHFKKINDTWGHPIGDEILQQAAHVAMGFLRSTDYLIRMGGEEFVMLIHHTTMAKAVELAENTRVAISEIRHPLVGRFTATFGVVMRHPGESFTDMYGRVDNAMYEGKKAGRNRVVYHDPIEEDSHPFLEWHEEWNSGEATIDFQHEQFLEIAKQIAYILSTKGDEERAYALVQTLLTRVEEHFSYEEDVLRDMGYPEADFREHAEKHQQMLQFAKDKESDYLNGRLDLSVFLNFIVDEVITTHFMEQDLKYFPFFEEERKHRSAGSQEERMGAS